MVYIEHAIFQGFKDFFDKKNNDPLFSGIIELSNNKNPERKVPL